MDPNQNNNNNNAGAPPKKDFLDKAVDMIQKKLGGASGQPVDPDKNRARNEKITDKIREFIEKKTGKKLPSKVSN